VSGELPLVTFAEVATDNAALRRHHRPGVCNPYIRLAPETRGEPLPLRTSWSSACAGSDQMTAPPDQATAGWSRSQRPWIRSVPTQDSDRGCSEWAVQQTRCAGGIAHIQACAAWARHGCFGSRGCSRLAMPSPRFRWSRRPPVVVTVGDHRTVCSPQPAAADRRPPARGAAPPPPDESRTAGDADLALLLLARLRSRARRRCPTPRRSAEVCESCDPRVSTQARAVAARRFLMVAGPGT
jgi:hypothetical protein